MMTQRRLGKAGPEVAALGYGAMVLEGYYGPVAPEAAIMTVHQAVELGMMVDTADAYGNGHNESLIAQAIQRTRHRPFIASKFGIVFDENGQGTEMPTGWGFNLKIDGSPAYVQKAIDASLKRLGVDCLDLWYLHFPDPAIPIEETVGAMALAVKAGKVRHLGLSNVNALQVWRAHREHRIAAVQYEYSLWRREAELCLLPTLRELGIALVAWSPLGSGFFCGEVAEPDENDFRSRNPKFSGEHLNGNRKNFAPILAMAKKLGVTPAQLSLAWLLHQGLDIIPIPGTRSPERVVENARAARVILDDSIVMRIGELARLGLAQGANLIEA
jgi:aryl-alcohol dehydrogenase-like predicted oxidoreductase